MKKALLGLVLMLCCASAVWATELDRVRVQVQFKQMIWICPSCGQEDIEDRPMNGGADYTHTCSVCATKFNSTGGNSREYNGTVNYTPEEYEKVTAEELAAQKSLKVEEWLYEVKHPPTYVEPSKEDYLRMYQDELERAKATLDLYSTKATAQELEAIKTESAAKIGVSKVATEEAIEK